MIINFRKLKKRLSNALYTGDELLLGKNVEDFNVGFFDKSIALTDVEFEHKVKVAFNEIQDKFRDNTHREYVFQLIADGRCCTAWKEILEIKYPNRKKFSASVGNFWNDEFIYRLAEHCNIKIPSVEELKIEKELSRKRVKKEMEMELSNFDADDPRIETLININKLDKNNIIAHKQRKTKKSSAIMGKQR